MSRQIKCPQQNKAKSYEELNRFGAVRAIYQRQTGRQARRQVPRGRQTSNNWPILQMGSKKVQGQNFQQFKYPQYSQAEKLASQFQLLSLKEPRMNISSDQRIRDKQYGKKFGSTRFDFLRNLNLGTVSTPLTKHIIDSLKQQKIPSMKQVCDGILEYSHKVMEKHCGLNFFQILKLCNGEDQFNNKCIFIYTMETFLYRHVNTQLRQPGQIQDSFRPLVPYCIRLAYIVFKKAAAYKGKLYRGLNFAHYEQLKQFLDEHAVGKTVTWYAFSSASKDIQVGQYFQQGGKFSVLIEIDLTGPLGYDITKLSANNEEQVLIGVNTTFRVLYNDGRIIKVTSQMI